MTANMPTEDAAGASEVVSNPISIKNASNSSTATQQIPGTGSYLPGDYPWD